VIRLALFDIDGTLIRSGGAGVRAFAQTFATEFELPDATKKTIFAGRTDVSLVREVFALNGIPQSEENFRRFFERYPFWLDHFLHQLDGGALPGVRKFIADLERSKNAPLLGLLTGNVRLGAELKLRRYELWQHFKVGAFADDHEQRNCIASIARQRGCEQLGEGLADDEVLVIGDTAHDVECGKSIGAKVLAVATGTSTVQELAEHTPTWAVADLTKISAQEILTS
jgi:phosphoglycolate phosphatase